MNKNLKLFLKFSRYLLPYWRKEAGILVLTLIGVGVGLLNPYLTKLVIDKAFGNKDLRTFVILALIGGGAFVFNGLGQGIRCWLDKYIGIKVNFDLSKKVFRHLERLDLEYFRSKSAGGQHFRIANDVSQVGSFIVTILPQIITIIPKLLFILGIVFFLNWKMAVFSICLAPILYLPPYYFTRKMRKAFRDLLRNSEDIFRMLTELFSRIHLIKAFGKEGATIRGYIGKLVDSIRLRMKNTRLEIVSGFAGSAATRIVIGLISFYGGYQVIKGRMSLGSLTAIMMYIGQLVGLQGSFAGFFQNIATGLISCERVEEILEQNPKVIETKGAKDIVLQRGGVSFKNVTFGYQDKIPVIKGISFDIDGGSYIALVGPSGCGKTTILNLILRLYEPLQGDIIIDGYNIKELNSMSFKNQIGIALQEPFLWNDTVENNIRYGRPDAGFDEIIEVSKICGVDDFVSKLQDGYKTIIGDNACKVSEGQKQKISIARALIRNPKILILDEAMSSMDSTSEEGIVRNIKKKGGEWTTIVVSHRLSTLMNAERVYFLKSPDEIVVGNAWELLESNKDFHSLFAGQINC